TRSNRDWSSDVCSSDLSIGSLAFRGCSVLEAVVIPASVTSIDSGWNNNSVFAYCGVLTLYVTPDSHAEKYAKERRITYEYLAEEIGRASCRARMLRSVG